MGIYNANYTVRSLIYELWPQDVPTVSPFVYDRAVKRDGFRPKNEHHITIIGRAVGETLGNERFGHLIEILGSLTPPRDVTFSSELYRIAKDKKLGRAQGGVSVERRALVAPVESPTIRSHIGLIAAELQLEIPEPFLHVTLFTGPDNGYARRGIGIDSLAEWQELDPEVYTSRWQAVDA